MLGLTFLPRTTPTRALLAAALACTGMLALPAPDAMAAPRGNVELLTAPVKPADHSARGTASVVATSDGRRVLNLRRFRIDPGPIVRVWLVPRRARSDGQIPKDYKDLGRLKGSRGNQSYTIPRSVNLRKYTSVVFWCVPFTANLARADLRPA